MCFVRLQLLFPKQKTVGVLYSGTQLFQLRDGLPLVPLLSRGLNVDMLVLGRPAAGKSQAFHCVFTLSLSLPLELYEENTNAVHMWHQVGLELGFRVPRELRSRPSVCSLR